MKAAYFDCYAGISGNMVIGAMLDAGLPLELLREEWAKLPLGAYELKYERVNKLGIGACYFDVKLPAAEHPHRRLSDILTLIKGSTLKPKVQDLSVRIFTRLAQAEAKVHNCDINEVHFHEVGAVDAIIDITGAALGIDFFNIEKVFASPLHVGSGTVKCDHGIMPIPAPATAELLRGLPFYSTEIKGELVTPTGAAIISTLAPEFVPLPTLTAEIIGYGAGTWDLAISNTLRFYTGETDSQSYETDTSLMIEANIDDMNPQNYSYLMEKLLQAGAADVYFTPIFMKKNRPGILLTVTGKEDNRQALLEIIFSESTTIGVRMYPVRRQKLNRVFITVTTTSGPVQVKVSSTGEAIKNIAPEWEDCCRLARATGRPLKEIYLEAQTLGYQHCCTCTLKTYTS